MNCLYKKKEMNNLNLAPISTTTVNFYSPFLFIATTIAWFFLFEENKIPGWKAIIPIYSNYIQFKLFYKVKAFVWAIIFGVIFFIAIVGLAALGVSIIPGAFSNVTQKQEIMFVLFLIMMIGSIAGMVYVDVVLKINIAKRYKKSGLFIFGLIFFEPFMIMYLAWDNRDKIKSKKKKS